MSTARNSQPPDSQPDDHRNDAERHGTQLHDQGYRRYRGRREPQGRIWWVIARAGILERLRERRFLAILLFAWAPFLVRAVQIYVSSTFAQAGFLAPTAATFREFLDQQSIFIFIVTVYVGSGLIANDRRANALQIYLSKPLTRVEYITGKLVTLMVFLTGVTLAPALMLLLLQMIFAGSAAFLRANLFLFPAITLFSLIQVLLSGFAMLALSSLSKSRRFVAMMYAGIVFFTAAMYQALSAITGSRAWAWMSPEDTLDVLADAIFRVPEARVMPVPLALLAVLVMIGGSIWILERRVRGVEVVT
jgi:ABC-2 type transport system permease protein